MLARRLVLFSVAVVSFVGCNCGSPTPPPDGGSQCSAPTDCPAPENPCRFATCTDGTCGFGPAIAGLVVADQTPGDCKVNQCDGVGNVVTVIDTTDVEDDGNECTVDTCVGGAPNHQDADAGVRCGADGGLVCSGAGACVGCNAPTDCLGQDTECAFRTCTAGACGTGYAPQGTVTAAQADGDCQQNQCDGQGAVIQVALATDVPVDGNACTDDVCTGATPSNPPLTAGATCADGGVVCDGAGACVACNVATDCPGQDSFCRARSCINHVCGFTDTAANTPLPTQTAGDCQRVVCDGAGGTTSAVDNADLPVDGIACTDDVCTAGAPSNPPKVSGTPCGTNLVCDGAGQCVGCNVAADCPGQSSECATVTCTNHVCGATFAPSGTVLASQTAGDCRRAVCDGAGQVTSNVDNADVPVDNQQCTDDVCTAGVPSNPPKPADTACTQGGGTRCNGTGQCVQCLQASHCGTATDCASYACNSGLCGTNFAPVGTLLSAQVAGNCHTLQCDGSGGTTDVVDNADLPVDGNQCTDDLCTAGVPSNPNRQTGATCAQNGGVVCDGFGACVQCNVAADCTGGTECRTATCTANACGFINVVAGTALATQVAGDCRQQQCDGNGGTTNAVDDTDLPVDANQCTDNVCTAGVPSNPNSVQGATCSQSGGAVCDGNGACVECNTGSDCASLVCTNHVCVPASCSDAVKNGSETGVDCGGSACPACTVGQGCVANTDCRSGVCTENVCQPVQVVSTTPANGATGVALDTTVSATFSGAVATASLTVQAATGPCTGSFQVSVDDFVTCIGLTSLTTTSTSVTATPASSLIGATRYLVRLTSTVTDAGGVAITPYSSPSGFVTPPISASACGVVISQVYGGGGNAGAQWKNDFIELRNVGNSPINLAGWSVQYASATGTTWTPTPLTGTIQPGGYYLVQEAAGTGAQPALPTPDATGNIAMSATAGKVALVSNSTPLTGACPTSGALVDLVGFGAANCSEGGTPTAAPSNSTAALRAGDACADSNNNGANFVIGTPTPRNTAVVASSCSMCGVQNELDSAAEADWCNVQFPPSLVVAPAAPTPLLYGRLYEAGVTPGSGGAASVMAQVGYALVGVDPRTQCGWRFFTATFNTQYGNDDEYQGSFTAPAYPGAYWYTFRFSVDSGATWTYADVDGAGSNAGLTFDLAQLPVMTVQ